jgi:pectate lyase
MLLGGGEKEADRDLGKMRFTIFGNYFNASASRNPLMRFGTFDVVANIFQQRNDGSPLWTTTAISGAGTKDPNAPGGSLPSDAQYGYNLGVYNQSSALVRSNVFVQTGSYPSDPTRIFTLSEDTSASLPARLCVPALGTSGSIQSTLNGKTLNVTQLASELIANGIKKGSTVSGAVLLTCDSVTSRVTYSLPQTFADAAAVQKYVLAEAGNT